MKLSNLTLERVVALTVAVLHAWIGVTHGGPVAVPDVSAYLSVAQWMNGAVLPADLAFHPGYGTLLAPFGGLDGSTLHTVALIWNGALAGLYVLLAAGLARRLHGPAWTIRAAIIVAAIHPALSSSSRIAWPETLLAVMVMSAALMLSSSRWTAAGIICGLAVAVHPRALVLVVAVAALGIIERRTKPVLTGLVPALVFTAGLLQVTDSWPSARIQAAQTLGDGPGPLTTTLGQWLALAAGTAGLAALGIFVGLRALRSRTEPTSNAFVALSAIGMLLLGGWVLTGSARIDTLMYGRYMGPWVVPLTVIGIVAVAQRTIGSRAQIFAVLLTVAGVITAISASGDQSFEARRIMTLSQSSLWATFDMRLVPVAVAAGVIAILGITSIRHGPLIPLALVVMIAASSTVVNHVHLRGVGRIADGQTTTAVLVPDDVPCLAHDISTKHYALWLYRLELPEKHHRRVNLAAGEEPCGNYVIAATDALNDCGDATLLAAEPAATWGLWRYPSAGCTARRS
ncbi:MAG: hypothetical protein QGH80_03430 [Acidimicrobiales bacterium]|nr:hypothetical protein [Acidimicrobiales bacterium]